MASGSALSADSGATDRASMHSPRWTHPTWETQQPLQSALEMTSLTASAPNTSLLQGHSHSHSDSSDRTRHTAGDEKTSHQNEDAFVKKRASKQMEKMITPYLAQHIPHQYNPLGKDNDEVPRPANANTKYCYRHRPDMLCSKQADEPTMEQLQKELDRVSPEDQQSIANVWSLFSAAPAKHRNLMLQGILAQCCFPQLSQISSSIRNLIKIDFIAALPTELSLKILCSLDTTSLCKAAQVSRRWRELADDDVVWHRMCEQHIDRKCTKCGWGLPLLDQRRLRTDKRRIQLRASGRGLNEWSPDISPSIEPARGADPEARDGNVSDSTVGSKRRAPDGSLSPEAKRICTNGSQEQQVTLKKRPWKDVYKDRFKVGTNWKYGRYTTTVLDGHTNGVMCLQFDDRVLMTGSYDATVKIWDLRTKKVIRTLGGPNGHTQGIRCLFFDECRLITGSLDNTIKMWNWRTGELINTFEVHSRGVIGVHMVDKLLASGSSDNTIVVHDFNTLKRFALTGHTDWVNCVKIDLPSRTLFSASDDCTVKLWDLDTKSCIKTFIGHAGQVQQVLPLPPDFEIDENDFVAHANNDPSDTASMSSGDAGRSPTPEAPEEKIFPNDPDRPSPPSYMLTGSLDGTIRLWHVPSGRCIHRFFGHVEGVWCLAADTLRLVSGAEDKTIKIWDPRTGKHERTLTGHTGPVTCVGLSDSRLISGSEDGTIRVHSFIDPHASGAS